MGNKNSLKADQTMSVGHFFAVKSEGLDIKLRIGLCALKRTGGIPFR